MIHELKVKDLTWRCPVSWLPKKDSTSIKPASTIVAQDRAVDAIGFGLAMRGIGFNVFVTGMSGTGRLTTIKSFVEKLAEADDKPDDICFVFNFRKPEEPSAIFLKAAAGCRLKEGMEGLIDELSTSLPAIVNDREFRSRIDRAVEPLQRQEREAIEAFEKEVGDAGFVLVQVQAGMVTRPEILPVVEEQPVPLEKMAELVEAGTLTTEDVERFSETHNNLSETFRDVFQEVAEIRRMVQDRVEDVRRKLLQPSFDSAVKRIRKDVADPRAYPFLDDVANDLGENLGLFMISEEDIPFDGDRFMRWRVNLVVDNTDVSGRPVVMETEPSYTNLFGTIERTLTQSGEATTSFMRIRAGSLMRANGGFLVLNADDLLMEPRVWPGLKRALKYRRVQIQSLESLVLGAALLKPEPVPINVKVVIIGIFSTGMTRIFQKSSRSSRTSIRSWPSRRAMPGTSCRYCAGSLLTRVCASSIAVAWRQCWRKRCEWVDGGGGFRAAFRTSQMFSGRPPTGRASRIQRRFPASTWQGLGRHGVEETR